MCWKWLCSTNNLLDRRNILSWSLLTPQNERLGEGNFINSLSSLIDNLTVVKEAGDGEKHPSENVLSVIKRTQNPEK